VREGKRGNERQGQENGDSDRLHGGSFQNWSGSDHHSSAGLRGGHPLCQSEGWTWSQFCPIF